MELQGKLKKNPTNPEFADLIRSIKDDIFRSMNCIKIGKIDSFDKTKKTAQVRLLFKRVVNDKIISYPVLVDCPVFTLQGGGGSLKMPIQAGDPCLVLFADRNIDTWYSTGAEAAPANSRCHDISDGIVLVGINSLADSLADYENDELILDYDEIKIALKTNKANIQNNTAVAGQTSKANLMDMVQAIVEGIQDGSYGSGAFVDTSGKMAIALLNLNALLYKD